MSAYPVAAWVAALVLFLFVGLQLLLAAGAPFGRLTWGGTQPARLSERMRAASAFAAFVLAFFAIAVLARADELTWFLRPTPTRWLTWVITGFLALNTIGSFASRSPAERRLVGPLSALALVATLLVALAP